MCLAIPAQIAKIGYDQMGTVDILGVTRQVALDLIPRARVGDYVLVHAGYGIEIIDERCARETLELIAQLPDLIDADHPGMGAQFTQDKDA